MDSRQCVTHAFQIAGLSPFGIEISFLAEGAWHEAYRVKSKELGELVVRFPKKESYGKPFQYRESELYVEYAGAGYFYRLANQVKKGICPEFHTYYVDPEFTFTIESFKGPTMDFREMDNKQCYRIGRQCGEFSRAMSDNPYGLTGLGQLEYCNGSLAGKNKDDIRHHWKSSTESKWKHLDRLKQSGFYLHDIGVIKHTLEEIITTRLGRHAELFLSNRDTSPENIVINQGNLSLIDPLPIIQDKYAAAGNLLNNYNTVFASFYRSPRYERHQFHKYEKELKEFGSGFLDGFSQGDANVEHMVKTEEFLSLLDMTSSHVEILHRDFDREMYLRLGDRNAVEERVFRYLRLLEQFCF